ncbi:MAG: ATP-binding protein [Selenomonadales bacterium]|nr:ATP-binding protein [Selenomonadales bacterium]MDY3741028.1 ATP-binding protein [Selenomonadaceae bacterium]MEE1361366.1 ATP-binding protein [Selenomonadaceae bacterium]
MPETLDFTEWQAFPAVMANYPQMLEFVTAGAESADVPIKRLMKLELGFEEAVVNVINYAYEDTGTLYLRYTKTVDDTGHFTVEIVDHGIAFNPFKLEENMHNTQNAKSLDDALPGGLGIPFVKKIFTEPSYKRENLLGAEANHLVLPFKI